MEEEEGGTLHVDLPCLATVEEEEDEDPLLPWRRRKKEEEAWRGRGEN